MTIQNLAVRYEFHPNNREDWLKARQSGIGSSDSATIMGCKGAFNTQSELYWSKVTPPDQLQDNANEKMMWGNRFEDVIAKGFIEDYRPDLKVQRDNKIRKIDGYPLLANIDRILVNTGGAPWILEVKNTSLSKEAFEESVAPGGKYWNQVQHQMLCSKYPKAIIVALFYGCELVAYEIEEVIEYQYALLERCSFWWDRYVVNRVVPKDVPTEETEEQRSSRDIDEDETILPLVQEFKELKEQSKAIAGLETRMEEIKDILKLELESQQLNAFRVGGKPIVTLKTSTRDIVDAKKFKAELPDVAKNYIKQSISKTLSVKV